MAINFPIAPTANQTYSSGETVWQWTGIAWIIAPTTIDLNDLANVSVSSAIDQQVLRYDAQSSTWISSTIDFPAATSAGGVNGQIQFNDNQSFAGNTALTFNQDTQLLSALHVTMAGEVNMTDAVNMTATTESTTLTTGVLQISGGAAITKQLNVGGAVNRFLGNTNATSTTTGTVIVTGGMGISDAVHIGSTVSADTAPTNAQHLTNKRYVDANTLAFTMAFGA